MCLPNGAIGAIARLHGPYLLAVAVTLVCEVPHPWEKYFATAALQQTASIHIFNFGLMNICTVGSLYKQVCVSVWMHICSTNVSMYICIMYTICACMNLYIRMYHTYTYVVMHIYLSLMYRYKWKYGKYDELVLRAHFYALLTINLRIPAIRLGHDKSVAR